MKILQFAFESDSSNPYLPHNYSNPNCVVYTGTHDNDTTVGWYLSDALTEKDRDRVRRYTNNYNDKEINWALIRLAFSSTANLAVIPLQDVFGFGTDCRMNKPGTSSGNWNWRCASRFLTKEITIRLKDETAFYGRLPQEN